MTYRSAADQIVTAIEAIAQASLDSTMGWRRFAHDKRMTNDVTGGDRSFNLLATGGSQDARRNGRVVTDVELVVDYRGHANAYDLVTTIHADFEQLAEQLKNTANWAVDTSTICVLYPTEEAMFPFTIDEVENEEDGSVGRRLTVLFAVEHLAVSAN